MPQPALTASEYVRLAAIRATPVQGSVEIHLVCEEDELVDSFRAHCTSCCALHLRPYASWLRSYQQGDSVDQPVIPVRHCNGAAMFDPSVAERDHPELLSDLNQFLNASVVPGFGDVAGFLADLS